MDKRKGESLLGKLEENRGGWTEIPGGLAFIVVSVPVSGPRRGEILSGKKEIDEFNCVGALTMKGREIKVCRALSGIRKTTYPKQTGAVRRRKRKVRLYLDWSVATIDLDHIRCSRNTRRFRQDS